MVEWVLPSIELFGSGNWFEYWYHLGEGLIDKPMIKWKKEIYNSNIYSFDLQRSIKVLQPSLKRLVSMQNLLFFVG